MKKSDFERAPLKEKVYRVLQSGKPLLNRQFLHFSIRLYSVYDFFAEIWYIPSTNKIDRVESLTLNEVLSIYDSALDISVLLK